MNCMRVIPPAEQENTGAGEKVHDPEQVVAKKHPCPDCRFCQMCSDTRCNSCRGGGASGKCGPKLSFDEQIRLYEEVNANDPLFRKKCK